MLPSGPNYRACSGHREGLLSLFYFRFDSNFVCISLTIPFMVSSARHFCGREKETQLQNNCAASNNCCLSSLPPFPLFSGNIYSSHNPNLFIIIITIIIIIIIILFFFFFLSVIFFLLYSQTLTCTFLIQSVSNSPIPLSTTKKKEDLDDLDIVWA